MYRRHHKLVLLAVSACLHLALLAVLGTITVLAPVHEPPPLVAVTLATEPLPLEARTMEAVLGALDWHRELTDDATLASLMPALDPTTVALPPSIPVDRAPWPLIDGTGFSAGDWSMIERAMAELVQPGTGRRGAFEGTVYQFRRIRAVRDGNRWFPGNGRTRAEEKVYAYYCQLPGRPPVDPESSRPWTGIDYRATVQWPEDWGGRYRFRLTVADGAVFQIDGEDVIDHDTHHGFTPKEGETDIRPGPHAFRLAYIIGPQEHLGLILHYHRVGHPGWQVFDLRPILLKQAGRASDPTLTESTTQD